MKEEKHRLDFIEIPPWKTVFIACSGGPDSMALADWYLRHTKKYIRLCFFHHGTKTSKESFEMLTDYFAKYANNAMHPHGRIDLNQGKITSTTKPKDKSWEEYWRDERTSWLNSIGEFVMTGHNLDDAVETWIWSSLHGQSKLIPYRNKNILRPLLLTKKSVLNKWCNEHKVPYYRDECNEDRKFMRSVIRHDILPHALKVNPGLYKVVKKKLLNDFKENQLKYMFA